MTFSLTLEVHFFLSVLLYLSTYDTVSQDLLIASSKYVQIFNLALFTTFLPADCGRKNALAALFILPIIYSVYSSPQEQELASPKTTID